MQIVRSRDKKTKSKTKKQKDSFDLSNSSYCPFCGDFSATSAIRKAETTSTKKGIGVNHIGSGEYSKEKISESEIRNYAIDCRCDSCGKKYCWCGFGANQSDFFVERLDKKYLTENTVDISIELRKRYKDVGKLLRDLKWIDGALLCRTKNKALFSRKHSVLYYFFVKHKDGGIVKLTTDFVQYGEKWRKLYLLKIEYVYGGEENDGQK